MDILKRLRSADADSVQRTNGSRIFAEAADEIERLRNDHEVWVAKCCEANGKIISLSRQIDAARIALTPNAKLT